MSSRAQKRLLKDLKELHDSPLEVANAGPRDGDIMTWVGFIFGPDGTVFEDGIFEILIEFGEDYPIKAPKVTFLSDIFHPNVTKNGNVASHAIESFWRPTYGVWSLLLSLHMLLREPVEEPVFEGSSLNRESETNYQDEDNECVLDQSSPGSLDVVEQDLIGKLHL